MPNFLTLMSIYLNFYPSNDGVSASVDVVGEHLELAGEDGNLGELLLLPLHNVRLVFREPGGDQISEIKCDSVTGKTREMTQNIIKVITCQRGGR